MLYGLCESSSGTSTSPVLENSREPSKERSPERVCSEKQRRENGPSWARKSRKAVRLEGRGCYVSCHGICPVARFHEATNSLSPHPPRLTLGTCSIGSKSGAHCAPTGSLSPCADCPESSLKSKWKSNMPARWRACRSMRAHPSAKRRSRRPLRQRRSESASTAPPEANDRGVAFGRHRDCGLVDRCNAKAPAPRGARQENNLRIGN
jgi:hypothetical protein